MPLESPTFQDYMRPLLDLLAREPAPLRARDAYDRLATALSLTPAQLAELIPSGKQATYKNRIGWARTYLSFAGLIDTPTRGAWRISEQGREFLRTHHGPVTLAVLRQVPGFQERLRAAPTEQEAPSNAARGGLEDFDSGQTPEELLDTAHARIRASVADQVASLLQQASPDFFESVVLDLLGKLGYGTDDGARQRVGQTGDGGIDGIISLDRLGLERVYIQAKRWAPERPVGPKEIREFFGSLAERKATKGVFMTTSRFTRDAESYATNVSGSLILIDGLKLVGLMIDNGVGVSVARTMHVPKVDQDYFEE